MLCRYYFSDISPEAEEGRRWRHARGMQSGVTATQRTAREVINRSSAATCHPSLAVIAHALPAPACRPSTRDAWFYDPHEKVEGRRAKE